MRSGSSGSSMNGCVLLLYRVYLAHRMCMLLYSSSKRHRAYFPHCL